MFVQTPEAFSTRFRIDVRVRSEVMAIDTTRKEVKVRTSDGKEYTETYDKLLLSPGASPVRPPLPGIDNEGIFTLRNVADTDRIKAYMQSHEIKKSGDCWRWFYRVGNGREPSSRRVLRWL